MFGGFQEMVKTGRAKLVTLEDNDKVPPIAQTDDSRAHLENWVDCMRARNLKTNAHIHTGFWHSIGAAMATRAYREGKKLYWDRQTEEIVDRPVSS